MDSDRFSVFSLDGCSICMGSLKSSKNKKLECMHEFHTECIDKWLANNNTCPLCRQIVDVPLPNKIIDIIPENNYFLPTEVVININITEQPRQNINNRIKCNIHYILFLFCRIVIFGGLFASVIFFVYTQHNTIVNVYDFIDNLNMTEYNYNETDYDTNSTIKNIVRQKSDIQNFEIFTLISSGVYCFFIALHIILSLYYGKNFKDTILFAVINGLFLINLHHIVALNSFNNDTKYNGISKLYAEYDIAVFSISLLYIAFNMIEYIIMANNRNIPFFTCCQITVS